jgi:very-short-patch-repair endonuclease
MSRELFYENVEMVRAHGDYMAGNLFDELNVRCQSPIESKLLAGLLPWVLCSEEHMAFSFMTNKFEIVPQLEVGPYRLDFAVFFNGNREHSTATCIQDMLGTVRVAVECDGHDFHEKTKEQAARDKARDRYLTINGWHVLRFTGSEIHADATGCAFQVLDAVQTYWEAWKTA